MTGYIKLHRTIFENELLQEPQHLKLWLWLLCEARYEEDEIVVSGKKIVLKRGQLSHSLRFIASKLGMGKRAVEGGLRGGQNGDMIRITTGTGQMLITICNYDKYQIGDGFEGTRRGQDGDKTGTKIKNKEKKKKEIKEKSFGFEGKTVRLTVPDYLSWRDSFFAVPDFLATLKRIDDWYTDKPPRGGNWFFPAQAWLKKEHEKHLTGAINDKISEGKNEN